uniref:Aquaporin 2C n=1 Tax=Lygus hesperus TaxID=30085 RepID=W6CGL1_LYGHE|nr:aquaporin 2C [Lygus hesperus]
MGVTTGSDVSQELTLSGAEIRVPEMATPLVLNRVTDSGGMTMSEFTNNDATIKVEEGKDTDSNGSKTDVGRYLEVFGAELVGTGVLLCIGCASCIAGDDDKPITDFHSALTFGFTVSTIICIFGHISAAHLNPAVTVAFYVLGHINVPMMLVYFIAQIMGAIMGVGVLVLLTPEGWIKSDMCVTQPHDNLTGYQAAGIEFVATMALIFLVCGLSDPRCAARQDSVPLKFAALLIALSLAVGKYTGASLNPVRSLGPAIWTGNWNQHWVYWVSPLSAGIVTPLFYTTCFLRGGQS